MVGTSFCFPLRVTLLSKSTAHKESEGKSSQTGLGTTMQNLENRKENLNALLANYRPIGPRHLLAAALMAQAKKDDEHKEVTKADHKAKAA